MEQITVIETNRQLLVEHTEKIRSSLTRVVENFMEIGFLLWEVREYKYYEGMGFQDVVEYAEKELNLKRSSTFNFIKLCETYSRQTKSGNPTGVLKAEYKKYSGSQLTEMLSLAPSHREEITPDMSVKQIREKKARLRVVKDEQTSGKEGAASAAESSGKEFQTSGLNEIGNNVEIIDVPTLQKEAEAFYSLKQEITKVISDLEGNAKVTKKQIFESIRTLLTLY